MFLLTENIFGAKKKCIGRCGPIQIGLIGQTDLSANEANFASVAESKWTPLDSTSWKVRTFLLNPRPNVVYELTLGYPKCTINLAIVNSIYCCLILGLKM
jgi:hypothetical protein